MTSKELADYLNIEERLIEKMDPRTRLMYERMAWVEGELNAGRRPAGVIVCEE